MHATQPAASPRPTLSSVLDRLKIVNDKAHALVGRAEEIEARLTGPAGSPISSDAPQSSGVVEEIDNEVYRLDRRLKYISCALDNIEMAIGYQANDATHTVDAAAYRFVNAHAKRPSVTDILRKLDVEIAREAQDGLGR